MSDDEIDKTIEEVMKEIRASPDYSGHSCSAHSDTQCSQNKNSSDNEENNGKLKVDIYVPLDACTCEWDKFMNRIFVELTPYIKHIDYDTKNLNSVEARNLNLHNKCIVVDGEKKFPSSFTLKRELPRLLKAKGLI
ncbi:unnamed protein product [marine sediment metagenome]|uniref:Uncharacterized protein n=1 Tax=marine sediment metagenome TaxID=412755 RepID=X0YLD4_9ZZZZ